MATKELEEGHQVHIIVSGDTGVGKTTLIKSITSLLPKEDVEEYVDLTAAALKRIGHDLQHKTLVFIEWTRLLDSIEILAPLSDGRARFRIAFSKNVKDLLVEGPFQLTAVKMPNFRLSSPLESRTFLVELHNREERKKAIQEFLACEGDSGGVDSEEKERFRRAYRALRRYGIHRILNDVRFFFFRLKFEMGVGVRDYVRISNLMSSLAFLRQLNRYVVDVGGGKYVIAEKEDLLDAVHMVTKAGAFDLKLYPDSLTKEILDFVKKNRIVTRRDVMDEFKISRTLARKKLDFLVEIGLLFRTDGRGRQGHMYMLSQSVGPYDENIIVSRVIESLRREEVLEFSLYRVLRKGKHPRALFVYDGAHLKEIPLPEVNFNKMIDLEEKVRLEFRERL